MNEDRGDGGPVGPDGSRTNGGGVGPNASRDEDLGPPIAELATMREPAPDGFVGRVVGSIRRRDLTSELATLWWTGLGEVFVEIIRLVSGLVRTSDHREGGTEG